MGRRRRSKEDELQEWAALAFVGLIAAALLWVFVIEPMLRWVATNWHVLAAALALLSIVAWKWIKIQRQKQEAHAAEQRAYAASQQAKGLVSYLDSLGVQRWGTPEEAARNTLLARVVERIQLFQPSREYRNEHPYQVELQGWLKAAFPSELERPRGNIRPDIVVGDIAIEVKGPTDNRALDSLAWKCMTYLGHFEHLVIVLFEPAFSEGKYEETRRAIQSNFPNVQLIRKESVGARQSPRAR